MLQSRRITQRSLACTRVLPTYRKAVYSAIHKLEYAVPRRAENSTFDCPATRLCDSAACNLAASCT